jgi:hypothetical protein
MNQTLDQARAKIAASTRPSLAELTRAFDGAPEPAAFGITDEAEFWRSRIDQAERLRNIWLKYRDSLNILRGTELEDARCLMADANRQYKRLTGWHIPEFE